VLPWCLGPTEWVHVFSGVVFDVVDADAAQEETPEAEPPVGEGFWGLRGPFFVNTRGDTICGCVPRFTLIEF
jgi:hypothetical protein